MQRKAIATILVYLMQAIGLFLIKKVVEPSSNTNQFITAALIANRIGCQAWCIDQTKIPKRDFWKKLVLVFQSVIASAVTQQQLEVYMFQDELLTETKCPKGFDVLLDLLVMSIIDVGFRGIDLDEKEDRRIDIHKIIQGMFVVFSTQSKLGIADISVKKDPDSNTHAIQQVLVMSMPIIGYRVYHYILRTNEFIGGVFNPIFSDQGIVPTFAMKFIMYFIFIYFTTLILHFKILNIKELESFSEKLFMLWHVGHGMPVKQMAETNQERVFFTLFQLNAHPIADGLNEAFNEMMFNFMGPSMTFTLFVLLQFIVLLLQNTDLNESTFAHSFMFIYDLGSSTGNADFQQTSEFWWEIIIVYQFAQYCVNFFYKYVSLNLDTFTALMIRLKYDHDSRFQIENDKEDEEQVYDENKNGEDKSDFNHRFTEFKEDRDIRLQKQNHIHSNSQSNVRVTMQANRGINIA